MYHIDWQKEAEKLHKREIKIQICIFLMGITTGGAIGLVIGLIVR